MTTAHNQKQLDRLKGLLKELFQLDKPELDFGLYKIMHAKSAQISQFLENDLLKEIEAAFGAESEGRVQQAEQKVAEAIAQANSFGAPDPEATPAVKQARAAYKLALEGGNTQAEIYDHLYRFFERYYDNGDFLSKRYYARENDSRAAPYSVPYDGREVYLHWANKDQYYIKSSEYLSNFSFDLNEAVRQNRNPQATNNPGFNFGEDNNTDTPPLKVHMHLAQAQEGEHGNIKAAGDQKREFIPLLSNPVEFNAMGELVLHFEYKVLPEGYPIDSDTEAALKAAYDFKNKGDMPAHWMADVFLKALREVAPKADKPGVSSYAALLAQAAPTETQKKRPLLAKYIQQYTARNTMDYFIHKDLGGFLRRELDFYIKNELMRLDDIESADAPRVEDYLRKIKALRRIAHQLIAFLAQLEDFQKKLWLKKKFVTETQYCITLDRVPESLYPAIAANDAQREEWVKLLSINELTRELTNSENYTSTLSIEFLKENQSLMLDTAFFDEKFKNKLIAEISLLDEQVNGILLNTENYQGINFSLSKMKSIIDGVYIDPPYNTDATEIVYKNGYKDSSWMSLIYDRINCSKFMMSKDAVSCVTIDECEVDNLSMLIKMSMEGYDLRPVIIEYNHRGRVKSNFTITHEYALWSIPTGRDLIGRLKEISYDIRRNLRRTGTDSMRIDSPAQFYGIEVDKKTLEIISVTKALSVNEKIPDNQNKNTIIVWPIDEEGNERRWYYGRDRILSDAANGLIWAKEISGKIQIHYHQDGQAKRRKSVWVGPLYDASTHGSELLNSMFKERGFDFPKSLYAVQDCLESMPIKDDGYVVDYFAGSGTTAHALINLNKKYNTNKKYLLMEMGLHFDSVIKPRIEKVVFSSSWTNGKPVSRDGISHCFKYLRLESYEDTLNNLNLQADPARDHALAEKQSLRQDYVLNYWLNVETKGSQCLLNVANFRDPTAYTMRIKQPGSDVQRLQRIDLIETFNWLIGLWVEHMAAPQTFEAEFARETDPLLPKDQNTRLVCKRIKPVDAGPYWFRLVEGYTLKVPGDDTSRQKTLVVWRKLTDNPEQDNAVLQHFLMEKLAISPREQTYAVIYVNGSHALPNPVVEGEQTKVRLIEEAFHQAMWSQDGA